MYRYYRLVKHLLKQKYSLHLGFNAVVGGIFGFMQFEFSNSDGDET
ncbi:MAG: hypothetical protein ACI8SE_000016 [Bacteroidia bacterium]|jgi:hypothetical protein